MLNFDFQNMKEQIQADFDRVLDPGPVDLTAFTQTIPVGGDPYERKLFIIRYAAQECPVQLFDHYPFAFKLDFGEPREIGYVGIGNRCFDRSGVDMSSLDAFREMVCDRKNLLAFGSYTDHLHRTLDHDKLLAVGFRGVYEECVRYNAAETDPKKKRYREVVMEICKAVELMGNRLRREAVRRLEDTESSAQMDQDVRYNLRRIADSVNTPWEVPVTMFDALNTILCTTWFISALDGVEMNAYGSLDRLIQPFYERDLKEGRITQKEAEFLIRCFLHKTDFHVHYNDERKNYDNGVTVMIGGCDRQGNPVYNDITDMILDTYLENKLINPKLNARASKDSPRKYLERLTKLMLSGNNNLVIENNEYIIPMFLRMGLLPEDARAYVGNGCQEVICPNQLHSRAFVYFNMPQVLLDTLRFWKNPEKMGEEEWQIYRYGQFAGESFEEILDSFLKNLRSLMRVLAHKFAPFEKLHPTIIPEPMMSAFTADCIKKGQDMAEGGARYYHKTFSLVGFGTLCDSLLSIRSACEKGILDQLLDAMENNFAGYAFLREKILNGIDRFGHSEEADVFATLLADRLANVSKGIYNGQNIEWGTSLFTYFSFQGMGARTDATPDGRLKGLPLSRQMNMASPPVLTVAARSMAALTKADFHDVGMFDLTLPLMEGESYESAVTEYIRTCLELQIPVLQTNVVDKKMLEEEMAHRGTHPDLIVRVCGYSAIFGQLSREMQQEIAARI